MLTKKETQVEPLGSDILFIWIISIIIAESGSETFSLFSFPGINSGNLTSGKSFDRFSALGLLSDASLASLPLPVYTLRMKSFQET